MKGNLDGRGPTTMGVRRRPLNVILNSRSKDVDYLVGEALGRPSIPVLLGVRDVSASVSLSAGIDPSGSGTTPPERKRGRRTGQSEKDRIE